MEIGEDAISPPESLKEGLRRQRQESLELDHLDLPIPEYQNPELIGRYRMIDPARLAEIGRSIRKDFRATEDQVVFGAIDSIIEACEGLYARVQGQKDLVPLDPDRPMIFNKRLADYLGLENVETARDVVIEVFAHNIYAIISHNVSITRWMGDRKVDLGDGLGGM
jgi:hypothetical protein